MNEFNIFLKDNKVKKVTPNNNLISSLIQDSNKRFELYYKQKDNSEFSKFVFENLYESLREISDAILDKYGFKSYSHEANIFF